MKLNEQHYQCMQLLLSGEQRKDVAFRLSIHPTTIYTWTQDVEFAKEYERLRQELAETVGTKIKAVLLDEAPNALAQVISLSKAAGNERTRLAASTDVLDRAGFGAVQKSHVVQEMKFPEGAIELIQQVLREMDARTIEIPAQGTLPEESVLLR